MESSQNRSQLQEAEKTQAAGATKPGFHKRTLALTIAVVMIAVVGVIAPTYVANWSPAFHWACAKQAEIANFEALIPALLVNSPFGGKAWGNVTYQSGVFGNGSTEFTWTQSANGSVAWNGFQASVSLYRTSSQIESGPGSNAKCDLPYAAVLSPTGNQTIGIVLMGPGNVSDLSEPNTTSVFNKQVLFENGFDGANEKNISTCGGNPQSLPVVSSRLTIWFNTSVSGQHLVVPYGLPVSTLVFHYWFPPSFGTWEVENLSEPGGPGGGWAFNFVGPCT